MNPLYIGLGLLGLLFFSKKSTAAPMWPLPGSAHPAPPPPVQKAPSSTPLPAGWRALKASEMTPELRQTAADISTTLSDSPGTFYPFVLGDQKYGAYVMATPTGRATAILVPA